jgi:hypothetical protein
MSAFVAEPEASADGWVVSDRKKGRLSYVLEERERNVKVWQAH